MIRIFKTWFFLLILTISNIVSGQSPYQFTTKKELGFYGSGIALIGLGGYFSTKTPLFTPDELLTLNPNDINSFDRLATRNSSLKAHKTSNYFLYGSYGLPVIFLPNSDTRGDFGEIMALYGETMFINFGLTMLAKSTFRRPRPYVFDPEADITRKQRRNAKASFVSGHTSTVAANTFFAAKVFSDYHPNSDWKPVVWSTAILVPAITGYLRVKAGRHYPTDTIAGFALGAAVGFLVPHLHK